MRSLLAVHATLVRFAFAFALALAGVALVPSDAFANPGITGYSGKPYNNVSDTCTTNCHAKGGAAPTLTITVPATVQAGSTTEVTLVVAGTKTRTSMNAAFSEGVTTIKGANTDKPLGALEPTEVGAIVPPPNGGTGTYKFSFIAPSTNGKITMWVAGMAANGGGTGGDGVANQTRTIMVTGGVTTPDAGTDGGTDAGGKDAGPRPEAGAEPESDGGELEEPGSSGTGGPGGSSGRPSPEGSGTSGCAVAGNGRATSNGAAVGAGASLALLVALRGRRRATAKDPPRK